MWYRRLIYGALLAGVLLFQITNENYLACFLLALCIALPLASLALSLPGMLNCRLTLFARPASLDRGQSGGWSLAVHAPAGLPLARLSMRLTRENLLTGQKETRRLRLTGVARRLPEDLPAATEHCGLLELRADRVSVCDYLGLFSLRLAPPPPARMVCRPADEREYAECLLALLSGPAPLAGPALDDFPELLHAPDGPVFRVHITPEGGDGHGG